MTDRDATISCSDAVRHLWDFLDRAVSPEDHERIEQHLSFCRTCCGELEFAKELRAILTSADMDEIPSDARARLERFVDDL